MLLLKFKKNSTRGYLLNCQRTKSLSFNRDNSHARPTKSNNHPAENQPTIVAVYNWQSYLSKKRFRSWEANSIAETIYVNRGKCFFRKKLCFKEQAILWLAWNDSTPRPFLRKLQGVDVNHAEDCSLFIAFWEGGIEPFLKFFSKIISNQANANQGNVHPKIKGANSPFAPFFNRTSFP